MANNNVIITAPVSMYDVQQVLGESSTDLATLCKSSNINKWAKYKPIKHSSPALLQSPITEEVTEHTKLDDVNRLCCGMSVPMILESTAKTLCGTMCDFANEYFGTPTHFTKNYDMFDKVSGLKFKRLTDFKDYYHRAECPFILNPNGTNYPTDYDVPEGTETPFTIKLYHNSSVLSQYNLMPEDILNVFSFYSDWKLRVEVIDVYQRDMQAPQDIWLHYYDTALLDTTENNLYGELNIPVTFPQSFPDKYPVLITPYLYDSTQGYAMLLPKGSPMEINLRKQLRIINIAEVYNGSNWEEPYAEHILETNALRLNLSIQRTMEDVTFGSTAYYANMVRVSCTYNGETTHIIGKAVERDGTERSYGTWNISSTVVSNAYVTTYWQFDGLIQGQAIDHSKYMNITVETSDDHGNTWRSKGGFSALPGFNA
jgi:hypothetical protein